ncbi:MAG: isochorismatase family protein [Streptosporangiaceae bacterium]
MAEDTRRIYERAGFGGAVEPGRTPALLVVDFSRGFTDADSPLGSDMSAEVEATRRVLGAAREVGTLVAFTSIAYEQSLRDGGAWLRKVPSLGQLTVGSRWVELDPRLGRRPDEPIVYKRGASAFFGTHLAGLLVAGQVDTVIVTGATTSGCVRASVVDAVQHGFQTLVIRDCVGDRAVGPHEANLFDMAAKYADLVSAEEAMGYLRSERAVGSHASGRTRT